MTTSSKQLSARAKAVQILQKIPVFHGLSEEQYRLVMSMCHSAQIKEGEGIFDQGDDGDSLYILLSGEIDIRVSGIGRVHVMKPGEILGEVGLVKRVPRTASAVAKSNCVLLQIYAERMHEVLRRHPGMGYLVMRNVARILADRLSESNKK